MALFWKKNLFDTLIKITTLTYAAFAFTGEKSLMILFQQTIRNPTHTLWWRVNNQLRVMIIAQQLFPHKHSSLINFFSGIKSRFLRSKTKAINGLYVMIWQMSIFKYLFVLSDLMSIFLRVWEKLGNVAISNDQKSVFSRYYHKDPFNLVCVTVHF